MELRTILSAVAVCVLLCSCASSRPALTPETFTMGYDAPIDAHLQKQLERIDARLRQKYGIAADLTDAGVLDLRNLRVAMIHPDHIEYAASVAKLGIFLAWFQLHPDAALHLEPQTRHELALMVRPSSNEMAAKFSREMGLREIQDVLNMYGFYDAAHGGGIWVGKHYGPNSERIGDPVANHSHAATVRQLLRFYWMLSQGKLVSPAASRTMREIMLTPDIPADDIKFVKGLDGRGLTIMRKWGSWEDWLHDTALVEGPDRRYVLVGLTHHPKGDDYLVDLAREVDDVMKRPPSP